MVLDMGAEMKFVPLLAMSRELKIMCVSSGKNSPLNLTVGVF